jgi:hypothetical protein
MGERGTTLAVTSNRSTLRRNTESRWKGWGEVEVVCKHAEECEAASPIVSVSCPESFKERMRLP